MMLIRQLPAGSMTMSMPSFSFPSFPGSLPSKSSLLLSLLASVVLLSFIRAAVLCLRTNVSKQPQQLIQTSQEKQESTGQEETRQRRSSWAWGFISWENLPLALPVSLTTVENTTNGRGVGLQDKRREQIQSWQPTVRRGGPAFESPIPAIYQSEVPVSMAKMIMSRHTYRKPTNRPPARPLLPSTHSNTSRSSTPPPAASPSSASKPSRRTPSMV
ncbi:hypothetical protein BDZ94DRAFT_1238466 [Collybia nuda]|uniref:Uncharacterized protein n=1 Tax=Collybia nuda TaxID=64659 RepID=A0A9P5Y308_9AGAR|nr:hypothetical protein BDZ94DRAFT_1238466 [Collybia nuda]